MPGTLLRRPWLPVSTPTSPRPSSRQRKPAGLVAAEEVVVVSSELALADQPGSRAALELHAEGVPPGRIGEVDDPAALFEEHRHRAAGRHELAGVIPLAEVGDERRGLGGRRRGRLLRGCGGPGLAGAGGEAGEHQRAAGTDSESEM